MIDARKLSKAFDKPLFSDFNLMVSYLIDGWIEKTAMNTITVGPAIILRDGSDDFAAAKVGEEFVAEFTSKVFTTDAYSSIKYTIAEGELPAGMEFDEEGTLEGTPEAAGEYNFKVQLTAGKEETDKKGATSITETIVYRDVTMNVAE